ncbi:MAG: transposase, partial [Waterburya sp.]
NSSDIHSATLRLFHKPPSGGGVCIHLFNKFPKLKQRKFWGSGLWSKRTYYASVGHISEDAVKKYIQTQKEKS